LSAYAAGGYFFRFAGKSNQKGATSLEEAIFFLYGNSVAAMQSVPVPATYCGGCGERFRTATRRVTACRGAGDLGKSPTYRKLPAGANRKDCAATIADARFAASRCVPFSTSCGGLDTAFRGVLQRVFAQGKCASCAVAAAHPPRVTTRKARRKTRAPTAPAPDRCGDLTQKSKRTKGQDTEGSAPYKVKPCGNGRHSRTESNTPPQQQYPPRRDTHHIAAQRASAIVAETSFR
ncbi:MAG: hypothetical protein LBO63_07090, partial [Oscillospiraceae bacterium]|nr:hypothetical protein [Oscillospiraceae bacterium]